MKNNASRYRNSSKNNLSEIKKESTNQVHDKQLLSMILLTNNEVFHQLVIYPGHPGLQPFTLDDNATLTLLLTKITQGSTIQYQ
ncbi:hypothetical protein LOAG_01038 [Loa loa]|uniref:Uncharacterized protein n=1 Tax=Loa loa TaxID=7209 RepID=A0A1S0UA08_LOALO|nr:hypothetical protein LOAG_01038 [Loa loa]EFO27448.2 hypothetical protein LOAG_01038 [Loa loa]